MRTIILIHAIHLIAFLSALNAFAGKSTPLTRALVDYGFIPPQTYQICPEEVAPVKNRTDIQLWKTALASERGYDACEPARYLEELLRQYPQSELAKEAKRELLRVYLRSGDFVMVMNRGNQFIEDMDLFKDLNVENDSEYLHYQIMQAVYGKIQGEVLSQYKRLEFVSYSLGANMLQGEKHPYLDNLRYRSFLEKYPKSPFRKEVESMIDNSKQLFGLSLLQDARMAKVKGDYPLALRKLDLVLRWGPSVKIFEDSIFEMVEVCQIFAMAISYKRLPDFKLAEMTVQPLATKFSQEERNKLAQDTLDLGNTYLEQMRKSLPSSPWTQKALKEFGEKLSLQ